MSAAQFSEDGLSVLLGRFEALAGKAEGSARISNHNGHLAQQNAGLRSDKDRLHKDLVAAEAKVAEWATYAAKLRDIIAAGQTSGKDKRRRIVMPAMPKPLDADIPF